MSIPIKPNCWINGTACDTLSAQDRGLYFGDGLFTTLLIQNHHANDWPLHWQRLKHGCQRLHIPPPQQNELQQQLQHISQQNRDCIVKCIITRGTGGIGYQSPAKIHPTIVFNIRPIPKHPAHYRQSGVNLTLCQLRLGHNPALAGIKHLNRLEQVLARLEWTDPNIAEGLLLDQQNFVIEGVMSNLFFIKNQQLYTPDLSRCGVAGIMRQKILQQAQQQGIKTNTGNYRLNQIYQADELFISNSVIGIWPVKRLQQQQYPVGAGITQILQQQI